MICLQDCAISVVTSAASVEASHPNFSSRTRLDVLFARRFGHNLKFQSTIWLTIQSDALVFTGRDSPQPRRPAHPRSRAKAIASSPDPSLPR